MRRVWRAIRGALSQDRGGRLLELAITKAAIARSGG